ncbi:CYFA0S21e01684g1_1 [Cyberlindnera fabianii]|uniref:CYFA0S21e01684g1_1 n=1 Tax=Cyberlindnera fabianii TaxID=36022 RepID=A0A061B816_CYBFA|nr:CYFA0S21e01684g1_1 [Cyberlindnera fabianii]
MSNNELPHKAHEEEKKVDPLEESKSVQTEGVTGAGGTSTTTDTQTTKPSRHRLIPGQTSKTPEELAKQHEVDSRSVYVGNVDYESTPDELEKFFKICGTINRITILFDRFTGYPKGYAYVEFETNESVSKAVNELNGSEFRGRSITVVGKRTNLPGFKSQRGRGNRGRGRGRGHRGGLGHNVSRGGKTVGTSDADITNLNDAKDLTKDIDKLSIDDT